MLACYVNLSRIYAMRCQRCSVFAVTDWGSRIYPCSMVNHGHLTRSRVRETRRVVTKKDTPRRWSDAGKKERWLHPLTGCKEPASAPGPLLAQGVNLPRGVWAGRGLESSIRLRGKPLRRDRPCFPASSVQHGEPWSLDEVAGVRDPTRSYTKKGTPIGVPFFV